MTFERQPPEAALEESAEDLYEHAPCGYLSTVPGGTIVKVNRTFLEWTGYRREDLVGRVRFQDLLTPGGRIYHETHYAPLLQMQGTVREIAVEIERADGGRLPVLVNSVLRRNAEGRPVLTRTTVFDATDRKQYERELLQARERERAAREQVEQLQGMTARLAATLEPREIGEAVLGALAAAVGAARGTFGVVDDAGLLSVVAQRGGGSDPPAESLRLGAPTLAEWKAEGEIRVVLVLTAGAEPVGVVSLAAEGRGDLSEDERTFALACASQAAQALERSRLHLETRHIARALQRSLLAAEPPRDARFAVTARYLPGVETLDVGGDWHDAFFIDEARLGVVVGDVVGRGLEAATAMGQLRSAVRALALTEPGPAAVLARLDRFVALLEAGRMATLAYCDLDLESGLFRFACAGHPPPALIPAAGPPEFLWGGRSLPLAAVPDMDPRPEESLRLLPGARIVLYTDGLVERPRILIDEGLDRLLAELERLREAPPARLVRDLTDAMLRDATGPDDVCVLCLDRL